MTTRRSLIPLLCAAVLLSGCPPKIIVKKQRDPDKRLRVAVLPFRDALGHPGSGGVATEEFSTHILNVPGYDVIERSALKGLLDEMKLGASGAVASGKGGPKVAEIGKLLGADAVITGGVSEFKRRKYLMFPPAEVSLTARMVHVETGTVEWSATHTVGGPKRLLTWILWPIGAVATATSPTAEDLIRKSSKAICKRIGR